MADSVTRRLRFNHQSGQGVPRHVGHEEALAVLRPCAGLLGAGRRRLGEQGRRVTVDPEPDRALRDRFVGPVQRGHLAGLAAGQRIDADRAVRQRTDHGLVRRRRNRGGGGCGRRLEVVRW
ncbi:MAG: hypothetical protein ACK5QX_07040 [bacterium]